MLQTAPHRNEYKSSVLRLSNTNDVFALEQTLIWMFVCLYRSLPRFPYMYSMYLEKRKKLVLQMHFVCPHAHGLFIIRDKLRNAHLFETALCKE